MPLSAVIVDDEQLARDELAYLLKNTVNAVDYLLKPFDKKRVALSVQKARSKMDSAGSSSEKLETLVRMLGSQKPQAMKILLKCAGRLFLVNQKDICYASIADGVITVA